MGLGHSKGTSCRTPLAKILDPPLVKRVCPHACVCQLGRDSRDVVEAEDKGSGVCVFFLDHARTHHTHIFISLSWCSFLRCTLSCIYMSYGFLQIGAQNTKKSYLPRVTVLQRVDGYDHLVSATGTWTGSPATGAPTAGGVGENRRLSTTLALTTDLSLCPLRPSSGVKLHAMTSLASRNAINRHVCTPSLRRKYDVISTTGSTWRIATQPVEDRAQIIWGRSVTM